MLSNKILIEEWKNNFNKMCRMYPDSIYMSGLSFHGKTIWHDEHNFSKEDIYNRKIRVYSMTKLYTMLGLIVAVQEKKVNLQDTLSQYVFPLNLKYSDENYSNKITIEHLLTHSSGLQHEAPIGNNLFPEKSKIKHINSLHNTELMFKPGENYNYSNLGYDLLGYIISLVYNSEFENLMQKLVFEKIGLEDITYYDTNECQAASVGMMASFCELLKGLNFFTEHKRMGISLNLWKKIHSIFMINSKQTSGYGYACKVFRIGKTEVFVATGSFFDISIVQMWSIKYKIGTLSFFKNGNASIANKVNGFNPNSIFYKIIYHQEFEVRSLYPQFRETIKSEIHIFDKEILEFVSCDNTMLYLCIINRIVFFSWDKEKWIKTEMDYEYRFKTFEGEFLVEKKEGNIVGIYFNGLYNFDYFYFNESYKFIERKILTGIVLAEYRIRVADDLDEQTRSKLIVWNRLNRILLVKRNNEYYINGVLKLKHIRENQFVKANGESVYINEDNIIIGNLKYNKYKKI